MSHTFFHDHCSYFQPVLIFAKLFNQINFKRRPLIFENSEFGIKLYFKGMILPYFQEVVLFSISSLDGNTKSIFLSKVVYVNNLQGKCDHSCSNLFQTCNIGIINDLPPRFHPDMISFLDQIVYMPKILVISWNKCHVALSPCFFNASPLDSHFTKYKKRIIKFPYFSYFIVESIVFEYLKERSKKMLKTDNDLNNPWRYENK